MSIFGMACFNDASVTRRCSLLPRASPYQHRPLAGEHHRKIGGLHDARFEHAGRSKRLNAGRRRSRSARSSGAKEIRRADFGRHGSYFVDKTDNTIWQLVTYIVDLIGGAGHHAFVIGEHDDVAWFHLPDGGPMTVEGLQIAEAEQAKLAAEVERGRVEALRAQPLVVVTQHDAEEHVVPTLAAARRAIEHDEGELQAVDGHHIVRVRGAMEWLKAPYVRALYAAEPLVVYRLERGEALPDGPLTPGDWPIVESKRRRR